MSKRSLEQTLTDAVSTVEEQLDAELERLEKLTVDDLEAIRQGRLDAMRKQKTQLQEWRKSGHGVYGELQDEKEFFDASKKSTNVVVHLYTSQSYLCRIVDKHMNLLAPRHLECRFVKLDATKCPFIVERFKVTIMPTLLLIKDHLVKDKIVGFTTLGNREDFSTAMFKWRIAIAGLIKTNMDLSTPPDHTKPPSSQPSTSTIRQGGTSDTSDDDEY